jgi:NAD(P)-dependent dehydrogenase (short-subunit alcohol dehydrogenase family)
MKLKGKVALVTGAGRGIGRAIALLFAKEGADIAVNDIEPVSAQETDRTIKQIGQRSIAIRADISEANEVEFMVNRVIQELGGVHILVNNAGIGPQILPTTEQSLEYWDRVVKVHLRGTYLCSRFAGKWMILNKTGKIVNIASITGMSGFPMRTEYGPAKAGIINMTKALAVEWAKYNINVNSIAPGYILTPTTKEGKVDLQVIEEKIPLGRIGSPDEIAKAALFLVSDDASYITGANLPVDGGWSANGFIR